MMSPVEQISEAAELLAAQLISQTEYDTLKAAALRAAEHQHRGQVAAPAGPPVRPWVRRLRTIGSQLASAPPRGNTAPPLESAPEEENVERASRDKEGFKRMYEGTRVESAFPQMTAEQKYLFDLNVRVQAEPLTNPHPPPPSHPSLTCGDNSTAGTADRLHVQGFLVIPGVLGSQQCAELRDFVFQLHDPAANAALPPTERYSLAGPANELLDHPLLVGILEQIVAGENHNLDADSVMTQHTHTDTHTF